MTFEIVVVTNTSNPIPSSHKPISIIVFIKITNEFFKKFIYIVKKIELYFELQCLVKHALSKVMLFIASNS